MLNENLAVIASLINLGVTIFGGFAFLMTIKSHQAVQDVLLGNLSEAVKRLDRTVEALRRWMDSGAARAACGSGILKERAATRDNRWHIEQNRRAC